MEFQTSWEHKGWVFHEGKVTPVLVRVEFTAKEYTWNHSSGWEKKVFVFCSTSGTRLESTHPYGVSFRDTARDAVQEWLDSQETMILRDEEIEARQERAREEHALTREKMKKYEQEKLEKLRALLKSVESEGQTS